MSQELESRFEQCRIRFAQAVLNWQRIGASDQVIESELAYILQEEIEEPSRNSGSGV